MCTAKLKYVFRSGQTPTIFSLLYQLQLYQHKEVLLKGCVVEVDYLVVHGLFFLNCELDLTLGRDCLSFHGAIKY